MSPISDQDSSWLGHWRTIQFGDYPHLVPCSTMAGLVRVLAPIENALGDYALVQGRFISEFEEESKYSSTTFWWPSGADSAPGFALGRFGGPRATQT